MQGLGVQGFGLEFRDVGLVCWRVLLDLKPFEHQGVGGFGVS